jgi:fluoride ion exporter CrcB/FEX
LVRPPPLVAIHAGGKLFEMIDAGHMALAGAYLAATLVFGLFAVRGGIALERRPELAE